MRTHTVVYKLSVTNLEFTLGLVENRSSYGAKVNGLFLPMSLRVGDSSVQRSTDGEVVNFIFTKDASFSVYDDLLVKDDNKCIPAYIQHLLSKHFYDMDK